MTDPKIRVGADVSAVTAELAKVQQAVEKINKSLSGGNGVGLDVKEAKADLEALAKDAKSLTDALAAASSSGKGIGPNLTAAADALDEAAKSAGLLEQVLDAVGQSSTMSGAVKNSKALVENLQRATKAQEALAKEGIKLSREQAEAAKKAFDQWRGSGARGTTRLRGTEFDEWVGGGWRNYSIDEQEARRHRARVLRSVGVDTPAEPGSPGPAGRTGALGNLIGRYGGRFAGALGGFATGMATGGGLGLGAIGGGLAGMIPGAGMVLGPLAGAIGGMLDNAIQRVTEQNAGLTDLRHSLGSATTDFEDLRGAVMYFTESLGLSGQEATKLAQSFAHAAGTSQDPTAVGKGIGNAAAFARGYGLDPGMSAQFFGLMRHYGVTKDDKDDKRLALLIGEAVGKNGMGPRMDEFMAAMQGYVEQQSRTSLTQANTSGYASFMASLTGLSLPGLKGDPGAAMAMMGSADAALRQGGAFGEASKVFSLGLYQRMLPGFNAFDMGFVHDQGAFGTLGRAFGADSPAAAMARAMGDKGALRRFGRWSSGSSADTPMLALQMRALERQYGGMGVGGMSKAIMGHLGVNQDQAAALYAAFKSDGGLGGLTKQLTGAGIDLGSVNPAQIGALAQISQMDGAGLRGQAGKLLGSGQLSKDERERLSATMATGDTEALRKMVLNLSALHDLKDLGEAQREQQANMVRALDKLAEAGLPLLQTMKDGITALALAMAPESDFTKGYERRKQQETAANSDAGLTKDLEAIRGMKDSPERRQAIATYNARLKHRNSSSAYSLVGPSTLPFLNDDGTSVAGNANPFPVSGRAAARGAKMRLTPEELAYLAETDRKLGLKPGTSAAQIQYESGNNPNAVSPAGARGLAQLMPGTQATLERRMGRPIRSRMDQLQAHRMVMTENMAKFGNPDDALRAYNNGWERRRWNNPETRAYAGGVEATRVLNEMLGIGTANAASPPAPPKPGKVPPAHRPSMLKPGAQPLDWPGGKQVIEHRVSVLDGAGNPHYNSVTQTHIGAPVPAGLG